MRNKQVIDHFLFRKLFAESFSSFCVDGHRGQLGDDYVIDTTCIRWHQSEDDFLQGAGRTFRPSDSNTIEMLAIIRDARLHFPCTPTEALDWVARSADVWTYVPDWLRDALGQENASYALNVLATAAAKLEAEESAAWVAGDKAHAEDIRDERRSLFLAVEAFEEIGRVKCVSEGGVKQSAKSSGAQGGTIANAHNNIIKAKIIAEFKAGNYASKNAAAFELAQKHSRNFEAVRKLLRNQ